MTRAWVASGLNSRGSRSSEMVVSKDYIRPPLLFCYHSHDDDTLAELAVVDVEGT